MKTIRYYLAPRSPWTYLGHERLLAIAKKHGATIEPRPFALGESIFPISGGLQLKQRPPQRQAYRLVELQRWSTYLGLPLVLQPKHFPMDESEAAKMIAATIVQHGNDAALTLTGAVLRAVWAQERDISTADTLIAIANECSLDGRTLYTSRTSAEALALYERNTQDAIELQVFGAPWYEYRGESFWGQDRLDFLDRALAAA